MNDKILNIQTAIGKLTKEKEGYNYKYFDINQLVEKLLPLLKKEGITVTQPLTHIEGKPAIMTRLQSGEDTLEYTIPLPYLDDPQKMGSAITYYRRYSLQSLFMLQAEDDDAASTKEKTITYDNDRDWERYCVFQRVFSAL